MIGQFIFILVKIFTQYFNFREIYPFLIYIVIFTIVLNLALKGKGDFFTITLFPIIGFFITLNLRVNPDLIFILVLIVLITFEACRNLIRDKFKFSVEEHTYWRILSRPFALLFIPIGIYVSRNTLILLIGSLLAVFFLLDLFRIINPKVENFFQRYLSNKLRLYKRKEKGTLSSMTYFLAGIFLCFLLFNRNIAFASLGFVTLGDVFGKLVGINFGKTKIFKKSEKTLEGSLAFFSAALTVSYFLWSTGLLSLPTVIVGALVAVIMEAISFQIDDNFTVSVISGIMMMLLQKGL
jgi:dolichol kinase